MISFLNELELIGVHSSIDFVSTQLKLFQVFQCITNNLIKHQSFVYIQLNDRTVLLLSNYRMIFFILIIFRLLYFIIQFGWALNYSALSSGAQTLGTVYAYAQRIWQSQLS